MPIFVDTFHYLQSTSRHYPLIDAAVVKQNFIDRLDIKNVSFHVLHSLYNITVETIIQNDSAVSRIHGMYVMNRVMLLEIFFRFSVFLFTNQQLMKKSIKRVDKSSD